MTKRSAFYHFQIDLDPEPSLRLPAATLSYEAERFPNGTILVHVGCLDFSDAPSARTQTLDDNRAAIDFDETGDVLSIELLSPARRFDAKSQLAAFVRRQKPGRRRLLRAVISTIQHLLVQHRGRGATLGVRSNTASAETLPRNTPALARGGERRNPRSGLIGT